MSCLKLALLDMGFSEHQLVEHTKAQQLEGYRGDKRAETAELVIPRRYVGGAANDIGFKMQEDGTYQAIISENERGSRAANKGKHSAGMNGYSQQWLNKLSQRYSLHKLKQDLDANGFYYDEPTIDEEGKLHMKAYAY